MRYWKWLLLVIVFPFVVGAGGNWWWETKSVKFEIKNEITGKTFKVSNLLGNLFLSKQNYQSKFKKITITYTTKKQEGLVVYSGPEKTFVRSYYAFKRGEILELTVGYNLEKLDVILLNSRDISRDLYNYLCLSLNDRNLGPEECGQKTQDYLEWAGKFKADKAVWVVKKKMSGLVKTAYALCSGTIPCGQYELTGCVCSSGSAYNDQCSNDRESCGPYGAGRCSGCTTYCNENSNYNYCSSLYANEAFCISGSASMCGSGCSLVIANDFCSWCTLVDGGWTTYGGCSDASGYCVKSRTCTNPSPSCGGATCSGLDFADCTPAENGCLNQSCPSYCDFPGGNVQNGNFTAGTCDCDTTWCPATAPCCTVTDPVAPVLSLPVNSSITAVTTNLSWLATSGWGVGCPSNNNQYQIYVGTANPPPLVTTVSSSTLTYLFTGVAGQTYYWQIAAYNGSNSVKSSVRTFTTSSIPIINSVTITNSIGDTLVAEAGSQNHICQDEIVIDGTPWRARFLINASDADGGSDITSIGLSWNGHPYVAVLQPASGSNRTGIVDVTFDGGDTATGVYPLIATATDQSGETDTDNSRNWKVWDCQVPVSGMIYDGSAGQACNTTGFSLAADSSLGFDRLNFTNMSGGANVEMGVAPPASYGPSNVIWGQSYLPIFNSGTILNPNGDLAGAGRFTRLINLGQGTTICPSADQINVFGSNVSAYSTIPSARVDFSFIRDQEAWFQLRGGEMRAGNEIGSGVPVTADSTLVTDRVGIGVSNAGMVASASFSNINGYNDDDQYGFPNNWRVAKNILGNEKYNYQKLYYDYFVGLGLGLTGATTVGTGSEGVVFVNGNLAIGNDVLVAANSFLLVVASGSISIGSGVSQIEGIYVADGGISASGDSATPLIINGMLYAGRGSNIRFNRSFTDKGDNNDNPAVIVNFRPDLIFNMPGALTKALSGFKEN